MAREGEEAAGGRYGGDERGGGGRERRRKRWWVGEKNEDCSQRPKSQTRPDQEPEKERSRLQEHTVQRPGGGPVKDGPEECKDWKGISEGRDGPSSRWAACPTRRAVFGLPQARTPTPRGLGLLASVAAVPAQPHGGDREPAKGPQVYGPVSSLSSPRRPTPSLKPIPGPALSQDPCLPGPLPRSSSLPPPRHPDLPDSPMELLKIRMQILPLAATHPPVAPYSFQNKSQPVSAGSGPAPLLQSHGPLLSASNTFTVCPP
ncbi:hypothetical protein Cadr_000025627 [Camelus dromedarius]|uniref:Uncharacterized protein n=1 Tax=Camelus dromedarius TaxID=9838 RepID=A0A5N4CL01_CAMDR|nr:hypothetical protein Cadr_000025627 [Camelus dromedarius]